MNYEKIKKDTNYIVGYSLKTLRRNYGIDQFSDEEKEWTKLVNSHNQSGDGKRTITFTKEGAKVPTPNYTKLMEEQVPKNFQDRWMEYERLRKNWVDRYNFGVSLELGEYN